MNRSVLRVVAPLAVLGLLGACRGDRASADEPATKVTIRAATCEQWTAADPADRRRLVEGMRIFFAGPVDAPGQRGQVLADDSAHRLFDAFCRQPFAGHFGLYRLYGRAAGFTAPPRKQR